MTAGATTNLILDVDTGVDDAIALAMSVASNELSLLGVTVVAGNVPRDRATENTLRVLDFLGASDIPVFRGMSGPLSRDYFDATHFHGGDGLGGASFPASAQTAETMTAPEFIVQSARQHRDDLTLVCVGPLTNLAVALSLEPDLPDLVSRAVIMGGAFTVPGNTTEYAEFNVAVDPEAARTVAESRLDATWVGLDVTHSTNLTRADWDGLIENDSANAVLVRKVCRQSFEARGYGKVHLHDPLAVATVLRPDVVDCASTSISVDTSIRATAGMTRMMNDDRAARHRVACQVDAIMFRGLFSDILGLELTDTDEDRAG